MDNMPLGKQTMLRVVIALEDEDRRRGRAGEAAMTAQEQSAFEQRIVAAFSDTERAALGALGPE